MFVGIAVAALAGAVGRGDAQKAATSAAPTVTAPPPADKPAQIDRNGVLMLVRSTLLALDHANKTGNYTVLRDLGAPGFAAANTATRLAEIFANLRAQKLDLSGIAMLDPQLTTLPTIKSSGMMQMGGFFPSVPLQVNFELLYEPVDGRWRLFGIGVNVGQTEPAAPAPPRPDAKSSVSKTPDPPKSASSRPSPH